MTEKKRNVRPRLRACLVYWDEAKKRYRITTPKTAKAAVKDFADGKLKADAVFLLTDVLDPRDAVAIAGFRNTLAESEIGACFYSKGPVTFDMLKGMGLAG